MEFESTKYKVEFKARFAYASKEIEEKYFLVGLAEDEYDYEKYIIFQKSYGCDNDDDSNTTHNGVYVECNGDSYFNCCTSIRLSNTELRLIVSDSEIIVDIEDVKLPTNFIEYLKEIFGELLEIVNKFLFLSRGLNKKSILIKECFFMYYIEWRISNELLQLSSR